MIDSLTFRMTGSLADAEDLAQETFINAYAADRDVSRHGEIFLTVLYRIAINTCLNWRQSEARRLHLHANCAGDVSTQYLNGEQHPARHGDGMNQLAQDALLKLPAKQRAAIIIETIYDGLNHAGAAARVLGISRRPLFRGGCSPRAGN